jgi:hypothetical protein
MNKLFRTALVLAFLACASSLLIVTASAQSVYGSVFGTVSDKSGAVIPNALVTVTDEAKGTVVTVTSNGAGDYSVPHLIPDVYDLKVVAKGFKPFETKGITVQADTAPRIDPTLDVGSDTGTTVEVNAESVPLLKTEKADVSTVFDQQQVSSLPIGDQNFTGLQLLLPGAQILGWSHASDENPQGSKQIQVDGQAFGGTAFELDGTDNQDPILGIIVINPSTDAVTETKITTQNFDAELGKAVSAVVTAQTRSGTNQFHGSAYDWRTGNANLARDPYSQPPTSITRPEGIPNSIPPGLKNRFGGSIGGPIWRDKAFFFGNYEGQRQKVGVSNNDTVPTAQMVSTCLGLTTGPEGIPGCDFSDYAAIYYAQGKSSSPQLIHNNTGNPAYDAAFAVNVVPIALVSPQAQALLTIMKPYTPNNITSAPLSPLETNYIASGTGLFNSDQWAERGDWTINEKMHLFERFSRFTDLLSGKVMFGEAGGPGFGLGAPPYGGNSNGANDSLATGMDIAINPKLLTDFRLGYYRYNIIDTKFDQGVEFANQLGIPGLNLGDYFTSGAPGFETSLNGGATSLIGGGLGINRCNCPLTEREDQGQIVNNWTFIKGNHTIKVGADLRYGRNLRVPSDTDRAGQMNFKAGPTSNNGTDGLGWATFAMGEVPSFGRYVGNTTVGEQNAKEFQKRTFFYGQDTWRVTKNLTLNLGLRWELYFPETVNGPGNGALLNINDGYLHVAGIGGIPSDLGWNIDKKRMFDPRIGITYQVSPQTVLRAGYGRSFDTGVFGSIFGHTVTQNLPVLANQTIAAPNAITPAFSLSVGPTPYVPLTVPSNGLLPNPGSSVSSSSRPNPLNFPTVDAWNLSLQQSLTPTLSLTIAYVGNKGTHTLGDGDSNGTNPNESTPNLPGANSFNGQALHFDPTVPTTTVSAMGTGVSANGGTDVTNLLQRYYAAKLPACSDPAYTTPVEPNVTPGMCGWEDGIAYRGSDQNTEFDALQVTLAKTIGRGLAITTNYQWASAFDETTGYYTWSHSLTHQRDSNVRDQQITSYGSYDLPFGKGRQFAPGANSVTNALIGGWQLSGTTNWSGGLPFTLTYTECGSNVPDGPCDPSATQRLATKLTPFVPGSNGVGTRTFYAQHALGDGTFVNPGLDNYGNVGMNTYRGPRFFSADMATSKTVTIHESVAVKFRFDAFNVFNHIVSGNPSGNIESVGTINAGGQGYGQSQDFGPRQLEFSLRVEF